jgi:hypothetical protein
MPVLKSYEGKELCSILIVRFSNTTFTVWISTRRQFKFVSLVSGSKLRPETKFSQAVINDSSVHPKAFNWQTAFPEVFAQGGFDVVVGNPPYIRQELLAPFKPYWEARFKTYHGAADIFVYFFELGIELLRPGGVLAFITSGSWVRGNFGAPLRKLLGTTTKVESLVDFGEFQPFKDAEMIRPSITILSNRKQDGEMRLFRWLTAGRPPQTLSDEIAAAPTISSSRLQNEVWELEPDAVLSLREKMASKGLPLSKYAGAGIYRGVLSGLTEAYVVDQVTRDRFILDDPSCEPIVRPFVQGTHLRPFYIEQSAQYLIALRSSDNFEWPWSVESDDADAEPVFRETYPALFDHLNKFREAAIKRTDQGKFWWELRSCDYWDAFDSPKIVWPDISKLPRFSMDELKRNMGNTGYFIPTADYYLLGVLSSWACWFFISKTSQPLRLRGDRWQYRLFTQSMEHVPIPKASESDREAISEIARTCSSVALERHEGQVHFQRRLIQSFSDGGPAFLNQKAEAWWDLNLIQLGDALKQSFKLETNPMKNPRIADEWESYLGEKKRGDSNLKEKIQNAQAELNERVFRLFGLSDGEIQLLKKEVEH